MANLATKCLEFSQHMEAQGKAFNFSLSLGTDFNFNLGTREKATTTKVVRKKLTPLVTMGGIDLPAGTE